MTTDTMYEIFDPRDGSPILTVQNETMAESLTSGTRFDFALSGEGW